MQMIRGFDKVQSDQLKAFVSNDLPLPSAMHGNLAKLRQTLTARAQQFRDLPDVAAQIEFLRETFAQSGACPVSWTAFASAVSCYVRGSGAFPDNTQDIFGTDGNLGAVCGLRSRYVILALRDLVALRVLKITTDSARLLQDMLSAVDAPELAPANLLTVSQNFAAAVAGFDSAPAQH